MSHGEGASTPGGRLTGPHLVACQWQCWHTGRILCSLSCWRCQPWHDAELRLRTSPVSVLPLWRRISSSISALSASPSTSPMQLRSLARLDQVLPCSSLKTYAGGAKPEQLPSMAGKPGRWRVLWGPRRASGAILHIPTEGVQDRKAYAGNAPILCTPCLWGAIRSCHPCHDCQLLACEAVNGKVEASPAQHTPHCTGFRSSCTHPRTWSHTATTSRAPRSRWPADTHTVAAGSPA